jgi:hypothetical protein
LVSEGVTHDSSGVITKNGETYLSSTTDGMISDDYGNIGGVLVRPPQSNSAYISTPRPIYSGSNGYKHLFVGGIDFVSNWSTATHIVIGLMTYQFLSEGFSGLANILGSGSIESTTNSGVIAVVARPGQPNLEIAHRQENGTINYINLGSNFAKNSYRHYRIEITKPKSSSIVTVYIKDIINGHTDTRNISTQLPSVSQKLQPGFFISSDHTSGNANLSFVKMVGYRNYDI